VSNDDGEGDLEIQYAKKGLKKLKPSPFCPYGGGELLPESGLPQWIETLVPPQVCPRFKC
jgi:hypothetical protein